MILGTLLVALAGEVPATPPEDYGFRQGVDYRIEAILDESSNTLRARARLRYTNNSPNTIDTLWIHQHLNAFRPNSAWAERELRFGEWRFQKQGPDDHAYERFKRVTVDEEEVRPAYRGSPDSTVAALPLPEPLEPGRTYALEIDMWSTSYVLRAGHRLRVEVTSSCFNRYDRNLNTGEPIGRGSHPQVAHQTLLHDAACPSHILLPVR